VLYRVIRDIVLNPVLAVGAVGFLYGVVHSRALRAWAVIFFLPLLVEAADMLATYSVPIGEGMRSDGIWALLLLPFAASVIVAAAERITPRATARYAFILIMGYALMMPLIVGTRLQLKIYEDVGVTLSQTDVDMSRSLKDLLRREKGAILLDATGGLDYLNVLVTTNAPERFILNVDADPVETALYSEPKIENLRRYDAAVVEKFRADKFWTGADLDARKLSDRGIRYILARRADYIRALEARPAEVQRIERFGYWVLFKRIAPSAAARD
jgi:hypothetical protein